MRIPCAVVLLSLTGLILDPRVVAEELVFDLEWGFGPTPCELYWDGELQVTGGRLVSLTPVSFEADRHDRLEPPAGFQSLTVDAGTDGMVLEIEGVEDTVIRLESKEGSFRWTPRELRDAPQLQFSSRGGGKLVVRRRFYLGAGGGRLSDGATQDDRPATCGLADGRFVILWRAFLGLPAPGTPGGDQIRGTVLQGEGALASTGGPVTLVDVLDEPGDVEGIAVASLGPAACQVVWAERRDGNFDLFTRRIEVPRDGSEGSQGPVERITRDPGVDRSPVLTALPDGSVLLCWQAWRGGRSEILLRYREGDRWGQPERLSGEGNSWNPSIASWKDGTVAVAWSAWRRGSYDVRLRLRAGGEWRPAIDVASADRFEAHPSVAFDQSGTLWIAYEEGRAGWGMDSHTAGLRSERNVRLRLWRDEQLGEPTGRSDLSLPESFQQHSEMAHLTRDGHGVLWVLFRRLSGRGVWSVFGCSLGEDGWSPPVEVRESAGGQNVRMASASALSEKALVAWPSDHRTRQFGEDSHIYATFLPQREPRRRAVEWKPLKPPAAAPKAPAAAPVGQRRPQSVLGTRSLCLFFGDLHRHTELSVCRTGVDGSLEDAHRYAIDAASLDFLCVTDHVQHVKILGDHDYWLTGKTADLNRVEGVHLPFYGYERSQRHPFGHRNVVGLYRNPKRVPRTADNRPADANRTYPGEVRVTPAELWSRLADQNVITIPHTSGDPVMGTDFGYAPPAIEPAVEIYQGCRYSYEYPSAPDPRRPGAPDGPTPADPEQAKAGAFIWDALSKGYRYGFLASSDHVATHNSYTCVWAEELSNASILDALRRRQCYAATDRIVCEVRMGEHGMGAEFSAPDVPPFEVHVRGTAELERVDVVKDNRIVYSHRTDEPSRLARFVYRDLEASPGVHYYYARVIQKDRNMAWVTPIWVRIEE